MNEIERAWLGAFIEADGSAYLTGRLGTILRLGLTQLGVEPVATALRITQAGTVMLNKKDNNWWWILASNADAVAIAEQCAPYSWKIQRALDAYKEANK